MFLADLLPTTYRSYIPNLGSLGAGPDYFMHRPISVFSENGDTQYTPPTQFGTATAFYKLPPATDYLHEQHVAAYLVATAAYSP